MPSQAEISRVWALMKTGLGPLLPDGAASRQPCKGGNEDLSTGAVFFCFVQPFEIDPEDGFNANLGLDVSHVPDIGMLPHRNCAAVLAFLKERYLMDCIYVRHDTSKLFADLGCRATRGWGRKEPLTQNNGGEPGCFWMTAETP